MAAQRMSFTNLAGADLRGADLRGAVLEHVGLAGADLRGADLSGSTLTSVTLGGAVLHDADLRTARLSTCDLSGADLSRADLRRTAMFSCWADAVVFDGARLDGAVLQHTSLRRSRFADAVLDGCESVGCSFQDADLTTARLFHRTRDAVAEVLRADADDDIERTSAAGAVALMDGWCWNAWTRYWREAPPYLRIWAARTFAQYPASGCAEALGVTTETGVELFRMPVSSFAVVRTADAVLAAGVEPGRFRVRAADLLGRLVGYRVVTHFPDQTRNEVEATVEPLHVLPEDVLAALTGGDGEIAAPVSASAPDGSPFLVAPQHWEEVVHDGIPELDADERHVRAEVLHHLADLPRGATVVDPACSSGAMLAAIADERPDLDLIGLDASPAMVGLAAERLAGRATVQHHDARTPLPIAADACICRALVRAVVSEADADAILDRCIDALRPGGMLVVASSGAPYHVADDLRARSLRVVQTVAVDGDDGAVFPFYRARRD